MITDIAHGEADLDTLKAGASLIPVAKITKVPKVVKAIGNVGKTGSKKGKEGDKTVWKRFTQKDKPKPDKNKENQSKTGSKSGTTTSKPNQEETSKFSQVKQTKARDKGDGGRQSKVRSYEREKYRVGLYNEIKGVKELDAHHVGQKALMKKFIKGYNPETAPAINVPREGHTVRSILEGVGIVSRSKKGITNARQLLARDIRELRRVYPDVPNSALKELIDLNKKMYPEMR